MIRLDRTQHAGVLHLYRASKVRFPLIGAVLLDEQDGTVFADDPVSPRRAYVEHAFGFAQVLGQPGAAFDSALERYLMTDKGFFAPKIRLYAPELPAFLADSRYEAMRSLRQRFFMRPRDLVPAPETGGVTRVEVDATNVEAFEQAFGVVRRFWRNAADFARKAEAVMVMHRGAPASACYAAARAEGEAEIDVLTQPAHQRMGLGKVAATHFVQRCFDRGITPLWDCFANNQASMQLSRSIGFTPSGPPYPFFTIGR